MVIRSYLSNLSNIFIKIKKSIPNPQSYLRTIKKEYKDYYKYIKKNRKKVKNEKRMATLLLL